MSVEDKKLPEPPTEPKLSAFVKGDQALLKRAKDPTKSIVDSNRAASKKVIENAKKAGNSLW